MIICYSQKDLLYSSITTDNRGNIYVSGTTNSFSETTDAFLFKLDKNGYLLGDRIFDSETNYVYGAGVFVKGRRIYTTRICSSLDIVVRDPNAYLTDPYTVIFIIRMYTFYPIISLIPPDSDTMPAHGMNDNPRYTEPLFMHLKGG